MFNFIHHFGRQMLGTNKELEAWNRSINRESLEQQRVLNQSWEQLQVCAVDSETTGFEPESGDEILSVAAVKWKGKKEGQPYHSYVRIEGAIPQHITELTGISDNDLISAPTVEIVLQEFLRYVQSSILIGFYIGHDIRFLNYFLWKRFRTRISHRVLELKTVIDFLHPEWESFSFDDVCEVLGVTINGRHTAIGDAIAVTEVWNLLVKELQWMGIDHLGGLYQQLAVNRRMGR